MDLIDRYIQAVGHYLPQKKRGDVLVEIRSLLEDTLENRAAKPTEADTVAVLAEFGPPAKVAESYGGTYNTLIGREYFPNFMLVLQIGLAVQVIVHGVFLAIALVEGGDPSALIGGTLSSFWTASLEMFAVMVLIFAAMERTGIAVPIREKNWDPRSLPKINNSQKVSRVESAFEVAFTLVALGVLHPLSDWAGAYTIYVRWASVLFICSILLSIYLLYKGRWQIATRITSMVISGLWAWFFATVAGLDWAAVTAGLGLVAVPGLAEWIRIGCGIAAALSVVSIGTQVYRMIRGQRTVTFPVPTEIQS